jgi:ATP:ADP antiporter, AAA family
VLKRFGTGVALPGVYVGLCRTFCRPDACRRGEAASRAALNEFRHSQPGTPNVLHRADVRGEVQSQKPEIYRGSDALYGWVFDSLQVLGLKLGAIALCMVPVAAGWLVYQRLWAAPKSNGQIGPR